MAKKKTKTFMALLINCMLIGFTAVVSLYSLSVAWFVNSEKAQGSSIEIEVETPELNIDPYVYHRDLDSSDYHGTDTDSDGNRYSLSNFSLQTYDSIFESMNKYTSALVRLKISGSGIRDSGSLTFKINRDTSIASSSTNLNNYFTSIISFGSTINSSFWDETSENGTSVSNVFNNAMTFFEADAVATNPTTIKVFPEKVNNTWEKKDELSYTFNYAESDLDYESTADKSSQTNPFVNIYVYIAYNKSLISAYKSGSGLSTEGLNSMLVDFGDDLKSFSISNVEDI